MENKSQANLDAHKTVDRIVDLDFGFFTTEHALKSAHDALWAIANMQITENTDKGEVLALCMSIARIELEKCSTAGKKR